MNHHKSARLFKNNLLEAATHVHPIIPLLMWMPVIFWLLYRSIFTLQISVPTLLLLSICGILIWTLVEYLMHRYLFHLKSENKLIDRIVFLFHGVHHNEPDDRTRLVMPPVPALILSSILYGIFFMILGGKFVQPFFAFFLVGYLCYDYIHYATHHFKFRGGVGKFLKRYHLLHHHSESHAKYGVSSPLWDIIFKTTGERKVEL